MGAGLTLRIVLLAALAAVEITAVGGGVWRMTAQPLPGLAGLISGLANLAALAGLPLLVLMVLLGSRSPVIERNFGLDRMMRLHVLLGSVVIGLFVVHGGLKILALSLSREGGFQWDLIYRLYWTSLGGIGVSLGKLALALLLVPVALARFGRALLPFAVWKPLHLAAYGAAVLGAVHALLAAGILVRTPENLAWLVCAGVLAACLAWRAAYVKNRRTRFETRLEATEAASDRVHTHYLVRPDGVTPLADRQAGQFTLLRLKGCLGWGEPHPFTIATAPSSGRLGVTVKRAGSFTKRLAGLKKGKPVLAEGPYGVFCPNPETGRELVMIAGGIGVTPFLSVIRQAVATGSSRPMTLIWSVATRADIVAGEELAGLAAKGRLKLVVTLSRESVADLPTDGPTAWEHGRLTAGILERYTGSHKAEWWLCGPPPMQRHVLGLLKTSLGVSPRRVRREMFRW